MISARGINNQHRGERILRFNKEQPRLAKRSCMNSKAVNSIKKTLFVTLHPVRVKILTAVIKTVLQLSMMDGYPASLVFIGAEILSAAVQTAVYPSLIIVLGFPSMNVCQLSNVNIHLLILPALQLSNTFIVLK